jgi:ATP-dependent RNA helicase DHX37/DHR1
MLVSGQQQGCLPYIISIVSALSVGDPFLHDEGLANETENDADVLSIGSSEPLNAKEADRIRRKAFFTTQHVIILKLHVYFTFRYFDRHTLHSVTLRAMCLEFFPSSERTNSQEVATNFVTTTSSDQKYVYLKCGCRPLTTFKAMEEIHKLRAQISSIVHANFPGTDAGFVPKLMPPNDVQVGYVYPMQNTILSSSTAQGAPAVVDCWLH